MRTNSQLTTTWVWLRSTQLSHATNGTRIKTIYPVGVNYLGGESHVQWKDGKVVQDLILKLKKVDSGLIVVQLEWVHVPGVKL